MTPETAQPRRRIGYEARHERIVEAALEVFAARGYQAATLDEIAARAGITKAVLYDHFPAKSALHLALLERERDALVAEVRARLGDGPRPDVADALDAFYAWVESNPDAAMMLLRESTGDPEVVGAHRRIQAEAHLAVVDAVLPPGAGARPREAMAAAVGGATHAVARWWRDNPAVPRAEVVETVMDVLWRGLRRTSRRGA